MPDDPLFEPPGGDPFLDQLFPDGAGAFLGAAVFLVLFLLAVLRLRRRMRDTRE